MECLKNFIGIQGCNAPVYDYEVDSVIVPFSGLYVNVDLPISLRQLDKISDEEVITFLGLWSEVQDRAIRKFLLRIKSGYMELFSVCDVITDAWYCENRDALAMPLLYFLGAELMFERIYSDRINRYTTIEKSKAMELRIEFNNQFITELKSALEIINDGVDCETGDYFSYEEVLP